MAVQRSVAMLMSSRGINIYEIWEEDTANVTCVMRMCMRTVTQTLISKSVLSKSDSTEWPVTYTDLKKKRDCYFTCFEYICRENVYNVSKSKTTLAFGFPLKHFSLSNC